MSVSSLFLPFDNKVHIISEKQNYLDVNKQDYFSWKTTH